MKFSNTSSKIAFTAFGTVFSGREDKTESVKGSLPLPFHKFYQFGYAGHVKLDVLQCHKPVT